MTFQETREIYLRIDSARIHFLKFILEGYDGLAILSTIDAKKGLVLIRFPGESIGEIFDLLSDIADTLVPVNQELIMA